MGDQIDTIFSLPSRYNDLSEELKKILQSDFSRFGLGLSDLFIQSITPPPEVQKAIDDKSRLNVFDDLNKLLKMKAAMAIEGAAQNQGEAGAGLGLGMGFMMPAMFSEAFKGAGDVSPASPGMVCPDCRQTIQPDAKFCPLCGHQILVFQRCPTCGKNLPANAKFCLQCGKPVSEKPQPVKCGRCGAENLFDSMFCNQCGERIKQI
jgi:membrane protease subunit (stomatin/prohibitin family)